MHCNAKTMITVAAVLGGALAVAYVALPEARTIVLASAPILLALVCPIAMVVMLFTMKGTTRDKKGATGAEPAGGKARSASADPVREAGSDGPSSEAHLVAGDLP